MESTIRMSGLVSAAASKMSDSRVSDRTNSDSGATPNRSARSFSWRSLSSPDTYNTLLSAQRLLQICSSKVDLPMPGAPLTSTREPATAPPPSTRSSSPIPVEKRVSPSDDISCSRCGRLLCPTGAAFVFTLPAEGFSICSSMVFQAPQAGHFPCQRGVSFPQFVQ